MTSVKTRMNPYLTRRSLLRALPTTGAAACLLGCRASASSDNPILLHGGRIRLGADAGDVEALVIAKGRVTYAGPLAQAPAQGAERVDLNGAIAFPGLVDGHAHLLGVGLRALRLDLSSVRSIVGLREALKVHASEHPSGPIVGRGWIETHWPEGRMPTRADLDAIVSDRPVWLERADGHAGVANSAALRLAAIGPATADPDGGRIERESSGQATGVLIDRATDLVESKLPAPGPDTLRLALAKAVDLYASLGWTGVADMGMTRAVREILVEMAAAGKLPIRVDAYMRDGEADEVLGQGPSADPTGLVRTLGVKLVMDGALGSRGALLLRPYSDLPTSSGLEVTPRSRLAERLRQARASGCQVALHAIGDRANRVALDLFEEAWRDNLPGLRDARWRIEHAQIVDPADIPRFGQLGVIASMQPSHAIGDLYFADDRLGSDRLAGAYAWRSLVEAGAIVCGGSDAPVEKGDPRIEYYAAVYRHDLEGRAGGENWHLEQILDADEALGLFTTNAAIAAGRERDLGSLAVGRIADVSVFDQDFTVGAPERILAAQPIMTMVEGRIRRRDAGA